MLVSTCGLRGRADSFFDRVISSVFIHAAVIVGDDVSSCLRPASNGRTPRPGEATVLEAGRTGVHLTTLEAATEADILVALRDPSLVGHRRDAVTRRIRGELGFLA